MPGMFVEDNLGDAWVEFRRRRQVPSADRAFGWPELPGTCPLLPGHRVEEGHKHLLQLSSNDLWQWSEGGWLHFLTPTKALRDGDFTQVLTDPDGW